MKIFISHSSEDIKIVRYFVEKILRLGLEITMDSIFCTSMEEHGIESGKHIPSRIREELLTSNLVIIFISKNYKKSEVCLNELGAAWITLNEDRVIPILLPDVDFNELGLFLFAKFGLNVINENDLNKFADDSKKILGIEFGFSNYRTQVSAFLNAINIPEIEINPLNIEEIMHENYQDCYNNNLEPYDELLRKAIPMRWSGIHRIDDITTRDLILEDLSKSDFIEQLWCKYSEGDFYVRSLMKLKNGNWILSDKELKITDMWVCMFPSEQEEFILIKTEKLDPFNIESDIGGNDYRVGILDNGTLVSYNEFWNGFSVIDGKRVRINSDSAKVRYRYETEHWFFLVTMYHKIGYGYNANVVFDFCNKIDKGLIELNDEILWDFLSLLENHPIVDMYL